jgi:hypothetical protein
MAYILFLWWNSPTGTRTASFLRFLNHIHWHTRVGRTPLDEGSARSRDLYLTTHNTHDKQILMPGTEIKIAIPASDRLQTLTLDSPATGKSDSIFTLFTKWWQGSHRVLQSVQHSAVYLRFCKNCVFVAHKNDWEVWNISLEILEYLHSLKTSALNRGECSAWRFGHLPLWKVPPVARGSWVGP